MIHTDWQEHVDNLPLADATRAEALAAVRDLATYELSRLQQLALASYWTSLSRLIKRPWYCSAASSRECIDLAEEHYQAAGTYDPAIDSLTDWLCRRTEADMPKARPRFLALEEQA